MKRNETTMSLTACYQSTGVQLWGEARCHAALLLCSSAWLDSWEWRKGSRNTRLYRRPPWVRTRGRADGALGVRGVLKVTLVRTPSSAYVCLQRGRAAVRGEVRDGREERERSCDLRSGGARLPRAWYNACRWKAAGWTEGGGRHQTQSPGSLFFGWLP